MAIVVEPYSDDLSDHWAQLLSAAKNGLFIFERPYIQYHRDRFDERSLIAFHNNQPVAILPLSVEGRHGTSYGGLTFGGLILRRDARFELANEVIEGMFAVLKSAGIESLTVKVTPPCFWDYPSGESEYVLWRRGFQLLRRDISSVLPLESSLPPNQLKRRGIKKAVKSGVRVADGDVGPVHRLIDSVLNSRHGVHPAHTENELRELRDKFPAKILLRCAVLDGEYHAAAVIYRYGSVWHTQYLAVSETGRSIGALDLLLSSVIEEARAASASHLSFGVSTENEGRELNEGLLWQKESFGARAICHDFLTGTL